MTRGPKREEAGGIFEINMTPLIDVSLVLVVILMVATPLALQSSIALRTAGERARSASKTVEPPRIDVAVLSNESVRVNREVVARSALPGVLAQLVQKTPAPLVVVRCEDGVSHGAFVGVLDDVRSQRVSNIAVAGR